MEAQLNAESASGAALHAAAPGLELPRPLNVASHLGRQAEAAVLALDVNLPTTAWPSTWTPV